MSIHIALNAKIMTQTESATYSLKSSTIPFQIVSKNQTSHDHAEEIVQIIESQVFESHDFNSDHTSTILSLTTKKLSYRYIHAATIQLNAAFIYSQTIKVAVFIHIKSEDHASARRYTAAPIAAAIKIN